MNWLAWRQHQKQFLVVGIFLILFAAFMIPTGLSYWHTYEHIVSTCNSTNTCGQIQGEMFRSQIDNLLLHLVPVAILFVPILLGLFWGVPFLAKEYTEGTNKLIWTQSVSRKKWLTVKLLWTLGGGAIFAALFVGLDNWWSRADQALNLDRFHTLQFSTNGIVLIGYAVFSISLGIFVGALLKRTMAALGVTLVLLIAIVAVVIPNFVRPYYYAPVSYVESLSNVYSDQANANGTAALVISQSVVNKYNQPINWSNPPQQCIVTPGSSPSNTTVGGHNVAAAPTKGGGGLAIEARNGGPPVSMNCLLPLGYKQEVKYQPAYRYWDFQRIETGLYLALSVLPIAGTYWLVLKRDA
ncbi:MAG: ABC transporter permease [Candidatus Saccharimonadales bacterium]